MSTEDVLQKLYTQKGNGPRNFSEMLSSKRPTLIQCWYLEEPPKAKLQLCTKYRAVFKYRSSKTLHKQDFGALTAGEKVRSIALGGHRFSMACSYEIVGLQKKWRVPKEFQRNRPNRLQTKCGDYVCWKIRPWKRLEPYLCLNCPSLRDPSTFLRLVTKSSLTRPSCPSSLKHWQQQPRRPRGHTHCDHRMRSPQAPLKSMQSWKTTPTCKGPATSKGTAPQNRA